MLVLWPGGTSTATRGMFARAEEGQRPVAMTRVHPFWLAELDCDLEPEHALLALLDVRERA